MTKVISVGKALASPPEFDREEEQITNNQTHSATFRLHSSYYYYFMFLFQTQMYESSLEFARLPDLS